MARKKIVRETLIINTESNRDAAIAMVNLAYDTGISHQISIDKYTEHKTRKQENTFNGMVRAFCEGTGNDMEDMRKVLGLKFLPCREVDRKSPSGKVTQVRIPKSWEHVDIDEANYAIKCLAVFVVEILGGEAPGWVLKIHDN